MWQKSKNRIKSVRGQTNHQLNWQKIYCLLRLTSQKVLYIFNLSCTSQWKRFAVVSFFGVTLWATATRANKLNVAVFPGQISAWDARHSIWVTICLFGCQRLFKTTVGIIRQRGLCRKIRNQRRNKLQNNQNQSSFLELVCSSCSMKWPSSVQIQFESQRFHFLSDWHCCCRKWGSVGWQIHQEGVCLRGCVCAC